MPGKNNGAWIQRALRLIRSVGLDHKNFWDQYDQGEWDIDVKVTLKKGRLPCGCSRDKTLFFTRHVDCKRDHYGKEAT